MINEGIILWTAFIGLMILLSVNSFSLLWLFMFIVLIFTFGKYKFSDDRLVIKLTNMNLGKSSYQQFKVNVDWFKKTVTIQHFNALTDKREDAVIGFDDLRVAPTVMHKHVKNKMQITQATVKEMEFAYENK